MCQHGEVVKERRTTRGEPFPRRCHAWIIKSVLLQLVIEDLQEFLQRIRATFMLEDAIGFEKHGRLERRGTVKRFRKGRQLRFDKSTPPGFVAERADPI